MIEIRLHAEGVIVPVRVQPGASADRLGGDHDGRLRVRTTTAPEKGKANKAVVGLLAAALGRKRSDLEIVGGLTHRNKDILIRQADPETIRAWLAECGEDRR